MENVTVNPIEALKKRALEIIEEARSTFKEIDEAKEWKGITSFITNMKKVVKLTVKVVSAIEVAYHEVSVVVTGLTSENKLDAAVQILDDVVKLPMYLEWMDQIILKTVISSVVEMINFSDSGKLSLDKAKAILIGNTMKAVNL
jgi:uncharacterized protein YcbX